MSKTSTFDKLLQLYNFYAMDIAQGRNEEAESWKQLILLELEYHRIGGFEKGLERGGEMAIEIFTGKTIKSNS